VTAAGIQQHRGRSDLRRSKGVAAIATRVLLACLIALPLGTALADELPGGELPVPTHEASEPSPEPSADSPLQAMDATPDVPGFKWWLIDTSVITLVTWGAVLAFNSDIRNGVLDSSSEQWRENISQAPEWNDGSDAVTNYVSHPMFGALEFLAYRSRGHGFVASSVGVVFQTFFLEYVVEGPKNVPSARDLLLTPLIGIPIGYGLDELSLYLLRKEDKPLRYLGYLANPFNLLPTSKKYRWQFSADPVNKRVAMSFRF